MTRLFRAALPLLLAAVVVVVAFVALTSQGGRTVIQTAPPAPPTWVAEFANAFCHGPASAIVVHLGTPLGYVNEVVAQAELNARPSPCIRTRYLGTAHRTDADVYLYVFGYQDKEEQWWALTAVGDRIVEID